MSKIIISYKDLEHEAKPFPLDLENPEKGGKSVKGNDEHKILLYIVNELKPDYPFTYTLPQMLPKVGLASDAYGKYGRETSFTIHLVLEGQCPHCSQ